MLHACSRADCFTLTLGEFCLEHETPVSKSFVRGRPFPPRTRAKRVVARETAKAA
jgi:hypothetical protein